MSYNYGQKRHRGVFTTLISQRYRHLIRWTGDAGDSRHRRAWLTREVLLAAQKLPPVCVQISGALTVGC